MSPVIACYVPPPNVCNPDAFLENLRRFPPTLPLILFSDYAYAIDGIHRMKASPEVARPESGPMWPAVSNMVFLTACVLAHRQNYTHMIYLEEDCRVVEGWDTRIWNDYMAAGKPRALGGSIVIYHSHAMVGRAARDATALKARNWQRNAPVTEYGKPTSQLPHKPSVFPNGALAVYPLDEVDKIFKFTQGGTVATARDMAAYDHVIGWKLFDEYNDAVFDHVVQLDCVFSSYKDQVVTEAERIAWLTERKVVGIHPVKNDWPGPANLSVTNAYEKTFQYAYSKNNWGQAFKEIKDMPPASSPAPQPNLDASQPTTPPEERKSLIVASGESPNVSVAGASETPSLRMDILIVTFAPDVWWLEQCLRSIAKFATGFGAVHVAYPNKDAAAFAALRHPEGKSQSMADWLATRGVEASWEGTAELHWHGYDETPQPLAHLDHNIRKCTADLFCPDADLIAHIDSDCFFREPVSPADYMVDGKPVLLIESFEKLKTVHPGRHHWKSVVDAALKINAKFETMCRHPGTHWRGLYPLMRDRVEQVHGKSFTDYVLSCKSDRPCGFAEFPTLGAYALGSKFFRDKYHFIDVTDDNSVRPHEKLLQFWSRQKPELPQTIWIEGEKHEVVPATIIKELLA